jgi:uncharacterized protein (DUF3820 family)
MEMPFGKYKGEDITDVPTDYLSWLEEQDWIREPMRKAVQFELERRSSDISSLGRIVQSGFGS